MDYSAEFDGFIETFSGLKAPNSVDTVLADRSYPCVPKAIDAPLVEVKFSNGVRHRAKFDNVILVSSGEQEFTWKSLKDLRPGDFAPFFPSFNDNEKVSEWNAYSFIIGAFYGHPLTSDDTLFATVSTLDEDTVVNCLVDNAIAFRYYPLQYDQASIEILDRDFCQDFVNAFSSLADVLNKVSSAYWEQVLSVFPNQVLEADKYSLAILTANSQKYPVYSKVKNGKYAFFQLKDCDDKYYLAQVESVSVLGNYTLYSLETEAPFYVTDFLVSPGRVSDSFPSVDYVINNV